MSAAVAQRSVSLRAGSLPALTVLGQTQFSTADNLWGNWEALWPAPELLVWKQANHTAPVWRGGPFPLPYATHRFQFRHLHLPRIVR